MSDHKTPQDEVSEALDIDSAAQGKKRTLGALVIVAFAMLGLGFASKPIYDTFCRVTGYGGTTQVADVNNNEISDRVVTVRFDSNVVAALPWEFEPVQREQSIRIGENGLAFYRATNLSDQTIVGTSNYNVAPTKAAPFFSKLECFCFTEQRIEPGETVEFPVVYFVDPQIMDDDRFDDVKTITLSYTFFPVENPKQEARLSQ